MTRTRFRARRCRGALVALAAAAAVSVTGLAGVPALAEPLTETTVTSTAEIATATTVTQTQTTVEVPTTAVVQSPVVTEAPQVVTTAPALTTAPMVTTTEAPVVTTTEPAVTSTAPIPTSSVAVTTSEPVTTTAATTTSDSTSPNTTAGLVPSPTTASTQTPQTTEGSTSTAGTTISGGTTSPGSATPSSAGQVAGATPKEEPQRLAASPQDVEIAKAAPPVEQQPPPAPVAEIDRIRNLVTGQVDTDVTAPSLAAENVGAEGVRRVLQWQPDWVQYDEFYRPLIFNPYREPLQVVYLLAGVPRIMVIPPFGRIVTEVPEIGSYNFTVLRLNAFGIPIDIAVGNFFGGGYFPGPGLPPPPPPPPVVTKTNVPVVVKYTNAVYKPFRVQKVVDVGPDPRVGEHKVLLDGVTPAWGEWKQTETGERQFEVHKTQSFPGMEEPQEGLLPGDYQLQLASDSSSGLSTKDIILIGSAVVVALLGLGAIVLTIVLGRKRPQH